MEATEQPLVTEIVGELFLTYLNDQGLVVIGKLDAENAAAIIREHPKYAEEYAETANRLIAAVHGRPG